MKYLSIIIFIILVSVTAFSQVSVNVYWTEQTEMDKKSTVYYTPNNSLVWTDFKGTPGPPSKVAAITASGFGYKANMQTSAGKGEINISVYCYFNKNKSWVRPGKTTAYILNHEQHHFDVSYLAAAIFINKIKNSVITTANLNILLPRIYKECCDVMNKMQDNYDGQTMNGQLEDKQQIWNVFFAEKLLLTTKQL